MAIVNVNTLPLPTSPEAGSTDIEALALATRLKVLEIAFENANSLGVNSAETPIQDTAEPLDLSARTVDARLSQARTAVDEVFKNAA